MRAEKQALRQELLQLRGSILPEERQAWDAALCRAVIGHDWFQRAEVLLGYYPVGSEPDIRPVLEEALRLGKALYLPCCNPDSATLTFRRADALAGLRPGVHGIPAPEEDAPELSLPPEPMSLCLVPGLAFDLQGHRLGYGKGYYDRFLRRCPLPTMGLCYTKLIQAAVPREPHDLPADLVLTEA